jgi:predicted GNAT family acetyltransferase
MSTEDSSIVVTRNEDEHRYQVKIGDELAVLTYARHGDQIIFLHTGVPAALEGRGVASKLALFALEEARAQHLKVIPRCPFVAAYIRRHQGYLPLLPAAEQTRLLQA